VAKPEPPTARTEGTGGWGSNLAGLDWGLG